MSSRIRGVKRQISDATDEIPEESEASGEDWDPRIADSMRRAGLVTPSPLHSSSEVGES